MRILGIETASRRGTVALVEGGVAVCCLEHERENAHGESLQPLIEQALAGAGWSLASLDRIAVGTGPGSFTGLRVGLALAQGLSEGLQVPLIGIGSLAAMARAAPTSAVLRCPVLDARHGEVFAALYDPEGTPLRDPELTRAERLAAFAEEHAPGAEPVYLGEAVPEALARRRWVHPEADLPHARWTALAAEHAPIPGSVSPEYVRHTVAVRPALPPNPLRPARSD